MHPPRRPPLASGLHRAASSTATNTAPILSASRAARHLTPLSPRQRFDSPPASIRCPHRYPPRLSTNTPVVTMSTMPASHGHNEACCNIPPVVSSEYVPKGLYEQLGGMKTYVTGPATASRGIICIFDIFGFFDQTLQGADILTSSDKHCVFIPDWFYGSPCPAEWYPPDTEEKQKKLGGWFGQNDPHTVAGALPAYVDALKKAHPNIESWCLFGYCWGGKVVELVTSSPANPFSIAGSAHPAMVDPAGADGIAVPYILIASMEEPADTVEEFERRLQKAPSQVVTFKDQVHGFMAARADLSDPHVRAEYARGYQLVLDFLAKNWS